MLPRKDQCCRNCDASMHSNAREVICRFNPPVPILYGMGQSAIQLGNGGSAQPVIVSHFPAMLNEGWCKKWELKPEGNT